MSLSINAKTYTADSFQTNQVGYNGPSKTGSVKDDAVLRRTAVKGTKTFSGMSRTSAKLTRTLSLTNALTPVGEAIIDVQVAIPVGYTAADVDTLLNDMGAFVASASFKTHVKTPQVAF